MYLTEKHIYGSSRLGMDARAVDMFAAATATDNGYFEEKRGEKRYELSNHLGNVLVVLSDQKLATISGSNTLEYYTAEVLSYNDYYPFGAPMHERSGTNGGGEYRYGFNGMESIDEMIGNENGYDFGARMYDGRLGRWWSVDFLQFKYPSSSCYSFCLGNPITNYDPDGKLVRPVNRSTFQSLQNYLVGNLGVLNTQVQSVFQSMSYGVIGSIDGNPVFGVDVSTFPSAIVFKQILKDDNQMTADQKLACLAWFEALTDDEVVIEINIFQNNGSEINVNSGSSSTELGDEGIPISSSIPFINYSSSVRQIDSDNTKSDDVRNAQTLQAQTVLLNNQTSSYIPNAGLIQVPNSCVTDASGNTTCLNTGTNSDLQVPNLGGLRVVGILFATSNSNLMTDIASVMVGQLGRRIALSYTTPGQNNRTKVITKDSLNADGTSTQTVDTQKR